MWPSFQQRSDMRTLLLASGVVVIASIAVSTQGRGRGQGPGPAEAQKPAGPDLLAIGGKDTPWFMDRASPPDTDSEPPKPFQLAGNVYYVGPNKIPSILIATPQGKI